MRCSCIVLLLAASIVAAAAAAAEKKPTFEDWLAGPKAGIAGAAKPSEEYYGEVETVDTCLRAMKKSGCTTSPPGPPSAWALKTFRWALTCCDAKHYGDYNKEELSQYLEKPVEVGQCQFQEFNIEDEQVSGDKIIKNATFLAQCALNDKSDTCGHPFCDKQVLTIVGSKYTIKDAIVSSIPTAPSTEGSCIEAGLESVSKPAYDKYEHREQKFYKVTKATLYHGTMTINSRLHNIKYEDGTFQFVNYIQTAPTAPVEATHAEVKEAYVLEPYKVELTYFKTKGY